MGMSDPSMLLFDSWDNCGLQCPLDAICSGDPDQCPTSSALLNVAPCTDLKCQEEVASTTADCQQCLEELEKLCSGTVCSDACFQLPPGPDSCNLCAIADNEHSKGQNACDTAELTHDNIHQQQQHSAFQQPALPSASSASSNSTHLGSLPTLHSCHWDGCQAAFVNKDDLTRHVTRDHLGCPFWSSGHASPAPPPISKNPASPRASSHPTSAPALSPSAALTQPALPDWAQHLSLLPLFDSTSSASSSLATSPWAASTATAQNTPTSWDPASFHTPSTTAASTPDFSLIHAVPSTSQSSATGDGSASSVADVKYHHCQWEDCTEVFDTSAALMAHVSDHLGSGKASYECKWRGCERAHEGRPFSQRQKAIRHLLTHTGDKPFACKFCAKTFSEATALTQHQRQHTNEKPHQCTFPGCGKTFALSSALTIHQRVHSGERPFKCTVEGCGKAFAESSNLRKHLRTHNKEKPYTCDHADCGKSFARSDQLARHKKIHQKI